MVVVKGSKMRDRSGKNVSYICKLLANIHEVHAYGTGGFCFGPDGNLVLCTPDGSVLSWNITKPEFRPYWLHDGNRVRPTLSPAIVVRVRDKEDDKFTELFHGHLQRGILRWG